MEEEDFVAAKNCDKALKKLRILPIHIARKLISRKKGDAVMRIDAYNQVAQLYGVQQTTKVQKANGIGRTSDQVSISQAGRDYQVAKKAVSEASDIREDKVAQLKNMVESGQYQVSGDDFASKLLEKYNSL